MTAKKGQGGARSNGTPAITQDIDASGDEGRAILLAQLYGGIQEQLENLAFTQAINDASDEDIVFGQTGPLLDKSGAPMNYAARRKQLIESKQRAMKAGEDIWHLVERVIEKNKQQRAQQLAA